jgi:hypothetical protein
VVDLNALSKETLLIEPFVAAVPSTHRFADMDVVSVADVPVSASSLTRSTWRPTITE